LGYVPFFRATSIFSPGPPGPVCLFLHGLAFLFKLFLSLPSHSEAFPLHCPHSPLTSPLSPGPFFSRGPRGLPLRAHFHANVFLRCVSSLPPFFLASSHLLFLCPLLFGVLELRSPGTPLRQSVLPVDLDFVPKPKPCPVDFLSPQAPQFSFLFSNCAPNIGPFQYSHPLPSLSPYRSFWISPKKIPFLNVRNWFLCPRKRIKHI